MKTRIWKETGNGEEPWDIHFDYQPAEKETLTYPGFPAEVKIYSVTDGDDREIIHTLSQSSLASLEEHCFATITGEWE